MSRDKYQQLPHFDGKTLYLDQGPQRTILRPLSPEEADDLGFIAYFLEILRDRARRDGYVGDGIGEIGDLRRIW